MEIITIGLDVAKSVFQAHGVDAAGQVVLARTLKRAQVVRVFAALLACRVGLEACATAHHWARQLAALGHEVKLISPKDVKPYVRRNKTDAADTAAICEAVGRPHMRFVPISKRGDRYLRRLLVNGAQAVLLSPRAKADPWIARLLAEKPRNLAAVALANKMARTAWAMIAHDQPYRPRPSAMT